MRAKEIARHAGKHACDRDEVAFLDDTVVLEQLSLRRNSQGNMVFYRLYQFEFTSDGSCRYTGTIQMLGKIVSGLSLEAHRIPNGL